MNLDDLLDRIMTAIMQQQGCTQGRRAPLSNKDGIDEMNGTVDVYKLCPKPGDSITVINCGTHYEVRHAHYEVRPLYLTDEEIEALKAGTIVFN